VDYNVNSPAQAPGGAPGRHSKDRLADFTVSYKRTALVICLKQYAKLSYEMASSGLPAHVLHPASHSRQRKCRIPDGLPVTGHLSAQSNWRRAGLEQIYGLLALSCRCAAWRRVTNSISITSTLHLTGTVCLASFARSYGISP
jgi:hypothetical protein